MIKIYPSTLPSEPIERHDVHGISLHHWLTANVSGYQVGPQQPISATVNGEVIAPELWPELMIQSGQTVELRIQPAGGVVKTITKVLSFGLFGYLMKQAAKTPNQQRNQSAQQGQKLSGVEVEANQPKLGDVIPELAGRHRRFPDYLTQPRRYFANNTTQATDVLLCIGKGEFDLPLAQIRIGKTPVQALGDGVSMQVFEPGANVTGHQASKNWYNLPEVGGTRSSAGLHLKAGADLVPALSASAITFSGANITVPSGAGTASTTWVVGMNLEVAIFNRAVEVIDGGEDEVGYLRDILRGQFADLNLSVGDGITITGSAIAGSYQVNSIVLNVGDTGFDELTLNTSALEPVRFMPPGNYHVNVDPSGTRYRIDAVITDGWTVSRLLPDGNVDYSWTGFPAITTGNAQVLLDSSEYSGNWAGPFRACPEGEVTSYLEFDVFAPNGQGHIQDDGSIKAIGRTIELQYRDVSGGSWVSVTRWISGNNRDQLGWSFGQSLPYAMIPEVRMRRIGAEDTATNKMDRLEWYGMRSLLPRKSSYPGVTVLALTLTGSSAISSQTENQVSVVASRKLPVRTNGEWSAPVPTRDIAPWVAHVAKSIGYTDAEIDLEELDRLDATWRARGDRFDFIVDKPQPVRDAINQVLGAGFAEMTVDRGRIRPVRDEPRSTFEHMYSPQNMTKVLRRTFAARRPDDSDGVEVEYIDPITWTKATVDCRLPGDEGRKVDKIKLDGVLDRTRAWRIGMRLRREQKYRRWKYSFGTELDALNSRYLSYCALADDVPGYGQSAWIKDAADAGNGVARLTVSEQLDWQDGESHVLAWRKPDGTLAGPYPASPGAHEFEVLVTMPQPWPDPHARQEPPHVLFGTSERWSYPALITRINPQGMETVQVEGENYHPAVYADDDNAPA